MASDRSPPRGLSRRARLVRAACRWLLRPHLARTADAPAARRDLERAARWLFRRQPFAVFLDQPAGNDGPGGLWISAGPVAPRRVLLYFHGGGYVAGSPATHRHMLARLSRLTGLRVFAADYRLAPEHPFPAQFEDARAAWAGLAARGYRPGDIVLGGDSAGGGLALALLADVATAGQPPAATFALSPWTDLTLTGASFRENANTDLLLPVSRAEELRQMVLQGAAPEDPRISPLWAEFPRCPPVLIQCAGTEILRDDAIRMAGRLRAAGTPVSLDVWGDLPHVWQIFAGWLPEADRALADIARFTRQALAPPPADS